MRATVKDVADTEQKHTVSHLRSSCVCVRLFGVCLVLVVHLSLSSDVSADERAAGAHLHHPSAGVCL